MLDITSNTMTTGNLLKLVLDSDAATGVGKFINCLGGSDHATAKFTVGYTGNTAIAGTLAVTGASTLTGNTAVGGTLAVTGASTLTGNTAVTGTLTTTGATALNGGLTMDTNAFTVADTSGNTAIAGTLAVTGASTLTGAVTVGTGYGTTGTTLGATGAISAKGALIVDGAATMAGQIVMSRTAKTVPIIGATVTDYDAQAATLTIAGLLGGIATQNSKTGASTATTPTGAEISAGITGVATGDSFRCRFYNRGNQTSTITAGASGVTLAGTAAVPTLKCADLLFVCTGANAWTCYILLSA